MAADRTTSVAAYHRTLSQHLSKLLQSSSLNPPSQQRSNDPRPNSSKTQSSNSLSKVSSADSSEPNNAPAGAAATSSRSTDTTTIPTPPELLTGPEDHIRAWKEVGSDIFSLPSSFSLSLDHRRRSTNNEEDTAKEDKRVKGLGIDLAMSQQQHMALKMGLMVDPIVSAPIKALSKPIDVRKLMPMASQESLKSFGGVSGVSPNVASAISSLHPSDHVGSQHRRRSNESSTKPTSRTRRELVESRPLRDINDEEKEEEYEARRQLRLKRKAAELSVKINAWREKVQIVNLEVPEIEPTPPTPSIASGMIRLSPLDLAPVGATMLPPAPAPVASPVSQHRPTSLPRHGAKSVPPPGDLNVRLRALDALLGDMSLVHPRVMGNGHRSDSPAGSLRLVEQSGQTFDADSSLGMPTPKPRSSHTVMAFDGPLFSL